MKRLFSALILTLLLCSCKTVNLTYFQDISDSGDGQLGQVNYDIKIEPMDELVITVTSEVPEATAIYNLPLNNPGKKADIVVGGSTARIQTYIVDKQGDINFPVLGRVHVAGMTTSALAEDLSQKIARDVEAPYVRVELVNFKVNVLGEVNRPGSVEVNSERFTILDALAEAGDMTAYGRRESVLLIREENGEKKYHRLNLNDSKLVNSPYYYLKQNDAIIVEPTDVKAGQATYNQNNGFKLSVISSIISAVSVISTLVIALVLNK